MRKATTTPNSPIIKPQLKVQFEQINFKIDTPTLERLRAYSEFIDSEQGYVIREALNHLFASDPAFQQYLEAKPPTDAENPAPIARISGGSRENYPKAPSDDGRSHAGKP